MIGRLSGMIVYKALDHVMIDVRGVGYIVYCNDRTLAALHVGQAASIFTDLVVREDLLQLMGFITLHEKEWYRLLVTVQGVGAKAAMAILGTLGDDGIGRAIALGDWASVKAAPGVGPKIAQRVVNELKDKAPAVMAMGGGVAVEANASDGVIETPSDAPVQAPASAPVAASAQPAAMSALANLGYAPAEASQAVATAAGEIPDANEAALIRAALKLLAPKG